jgi:hypothetical protein
MSRRKLSYRSPFVESDGSDDNNAGNSPQIPGLAAAPATTAPVVPQSTTTKRKRAAMERDILDDDDWEEIGIPQDHATRAPKRPRAKEPENVGNDNLPEMALNNSTKEKKREWDSRRTSDSFLATEVRSRQEQGLPALSKVEEDVFIAQHADMINKIQNNITFDQIQKNTGMLRMLTTNRQAESAYDIHTAALFAAQLSRVSIELEAIDAFMNSRTEVRLQDASTMTASIDRLYQHLFTDRMWRHLIAHLGLMTKSLSVLRGLVKTSPQLRSIAHIVAKIDTIETLLTPSANVDYDAATLSEPPDNSRAHTRASAADIAEIEERHKKELAKKDREIVSMQLRLDHAMATRGKDQDSQFSQGTVDRLSMERDTAKQSHTDDIASLEEKSKNDSAIREDKYKRDVASIKEKYASDLEKCEDAFEKKFYEEVQKSKAEEKLKTEQEAVRLRMEKESQELAKAVKRDDLRSIALKRSTDIKLLYNRQRDGTIAQARDTEVIALQECVNGLTDLWAEQGSSTHNPVLL